MKTLIVGILLLLSKYVFSQENLNIRGQWVVDSFKQHTATELVMSDGRDLWQFSKGMWHIFSSGKHVATTNVHLNNRQIKVKKPSNYESMEIVYIHGDTYLQLRNTLLTYNLIRVEQRNKDN